MTGNKYWDDGYCHGGDVGTAGKGLEDLSAVFASNVAETTAERVW